MFVVWFNAESILLLLKQEPEVARLAALYLKWVSIGLPVNILIFELSVNDYPDILQSRATHLTV